MVLIGGEGEGGSVGGVQEDEGLRTGLDLDHHPCTFPGSDDVYTHSCHPP
jgi:hypothetical protein